MAFGNFCWAFGLETLVDQLLCALVAANWKEAKRKQAFDQSLLPR